MYNLSVLNDKEFELLSKDILEHELGVSFQIFKKGKDKGIDLRYSSGQENKIIVQAKHYINSTYASLKYKLVKEEIIKIAELNPLPNRYIIFTSLSLSVSQVNELFELLRPFVKDTNDIYAQDRVIEMVKNNPKIEEKYYKLWLTSTNVLKTILNNAIKGRSEFYRERILKKLSLYVPTQNYNDAIGKINENRFIIITGDPGVGKTTISYLLICDLLAKGYELIYITDKISEAENVISSDPEVKQVIYFDDFLGANLAEIINPRNTESSIVGLIERIIHLKNKFLILTTRTTILNQAQNSYEKLSNSNFASVSKYQIEVGQYSRLDKARILYNHLFHSTLPVKNPDYFSIFFENKNYLKIVDHRNFSPRLIEFITSGNIINSLKPDNHLEFIMNHLENPGQIWKGAYENQLTDDDRFLLTTLFSLGGYNVSQNNLEKAYHARFKYEIDRNGFTLSIDSFNKSIRKLLDGFISATKDSSTNLNRFSFLNPSVADFIFNYLKIRPQEKWRIIRSVIFIEQITHYFYPHNNLIENHIPFEKEELNEFFSFYVMNSNKLIFADGRNMSKAIEILKIYFEYFPDKITVELIQSAVSDINADEITSNQFYDTIKILEQLTRFPLISIIQAKWDSIINKLLQLCDTPDEFNRIKNLFDLYQIINGLVKW